MKSLGDYLIRPSKSVYMTKTLALKLNQALRNAAHPGANKMGHYSILEAAAH